jgi:imidazolonepropionase-like amidohydrolase
MKTARGLTSVPGGQLVDGTGPRAIADAVVQMKDGTIVYAGPAPRAPRLPVDARRIDARGGTIMPGLVEAHFHPTYFNVAGLADLDIKYPVEYVTLLAAANARLAPECGYTAARSGGSLHNIDVSGSRRPSRKTCSSVPGWPPAVARSAAREGSWTGTPTISSWGRKD